MFQAERFANLRKNRGLTQEQLAEMVGVGRVTITRFESGAQTPDATVLGKIANALCVSADYLLGRTESQFGQSIAEARATYLVSTGDPDEDEIRRKTLVAFDRDIQKIRRDYLSDDFRILANIAKELAKRKKSGENI